MAIQDKDEATGTSTGSKLGGGAPRRETRGNDSSNFDRAPAGGDTSNRREDTRPKRSFSSIGQEVDKVMPLTQAGEALARTQNALQEVLNSYKEGTGKAIARLIPVDISPADRIPVAYLIVATQLTDNPEAGVGFQPLIIEGSLPGNVTPGEHFVGSRKIEVFRSVADADTDEVRETLWNIVANAYGTDKVFGAMSMVIPRTMNLEDKGAIKDLTAKVSFNATVELQRHTTLDPLNLADFVGGDEQLSAVLTYDSTQQRNLVGQPVRSDIKIDLVAEPRDRKSQQSGIGSVGAVTLAHIDAYVDFIYQPVIELDANGMVPQSAQSGYGINPDIYRKFITRVVLTSMKSLTLTTLDGQMFALAAALGIRSNNYFMGALLPRRDADAGEVDMRDVGALNIEANFLGDPTVAGAPMDVKADGFSTGQLFQFVNGVTRQNQVVFSIDVSQRGEDTCYNGVLAAADDGDEVAIQAIIDSLDALTDNHFSEHFPSDGQLTLMNAEIFHAGHYKNAHQEIRDIRDIDTLALYNLYGQSRKEVVNDWLDTIVKTEYDELQRLDARLNILRQVTTNVVVTGTFRRVTFTKQMIDAFISAIADTRISIPVTAPYLDTASNARGVGNYGAALTSGGSSVYSQRQSNDTRNPSVRRGGFRNNWGN